MRRVAAGIYIFEKNTYDLELLSVCARKTENSPRDGVTTNHLHRRGQMRGTGAGEKGKEIAVDKTVSARKQAFEIYK
jgi:hypothetical protein